MFGTGSNNGTAAAGGASASNNGRPTAASVANVDTNLTQVFASSDATDGIHVFVNAQPIAPGSLENVGIEIVAPSDAEPSGKLTAILSRYASGNTGAAPAQTTTALFPGTVEILARGHRIVLSCPAADSFDGLYLGLGLREDGTSTELTGVQSLRIVIAPNLIDAKLVWVEDDREEDLLS